MFFFHYSVFPNPNCCHRHFKGLTCWLYEFSVSKGHWLGECAFEYSRNQGIITRTKFDRVFFYPRIGCLYKKLLQIFNVYIDAFCYVTIRPIHFYILRMTFL